MIDYDFNALINKYNQLDSDPFYKKIRDISISADGDLIDCLWDQIKEISKTQFYPDPKDDLDYMKMDVLYSLYASICYTTDPGLSWGQIIAVLQNIDSALTNEDSLNSERQLLSHKKGKLRKTYQPSDITVLLSGQYFNNNSLLYFRSFWQTDAQPTRCFNVGDYIKYIKNSNYWPFDNQYANGMLFNDYFKGIRNMCPDFWADRLQRDNFFDAEFSFYIFEQLFSPVSFIDNLLLHQQYFADIFNNVSNPSREMAIILLQPLFQLPHSLWKHLSNDYAESLRRYIDNVGNIDYGSTLFQKMYIVILYKQLIYPLLKIMIGNYLINTYDDDLASLKEYLHNYLIENTDYSHYQDAFRSQMDSLSTALYPNNTAIDSMGYYMAEMRKYKSLNKEARSKQKKPIEPKGNDSKRNNKSIESYEINFTYQFFRQPAELDFFDYGNSRGKCNPDAYIKQQINTYFQKAMQTPGGYSTPNYRQHKAADLGLFLY